MSGDLLREGDPVHHPVHYTSHPSGIEVIEYTRLLPFGPGNAVKYVMRRGHKGNAQQDLEKALWYLNDSLVEGIDYRITPKMRQIVGKVTAHEPNIEVVVFLTALYLAPTSEPLMYDARHAVQALLAGTSK